MKVEVNATPFAWLALAAVLGSSLSALAEDYGIAGGPVGADRIAKIAQAPVSPGPADVGQRFGNAGGLVGAEAIAHVSQTRVSASKADFAGWYGRAGGPVGFAAVKHADTKVAQLKR